MIPALRELTMIQVRDSRRLGVGVLSVLLTIAFVQAPEARGEEGQECTCVSDFDALVNKLEMNYAAIPIEVRGKREREYEAVKERTRQAAVRAQTAEDCVYVLRGLTGWFRDPHLFIGQFPNYDDAALASFRASAERLAVTADDVRSRLEGNASTHSLEGIWFDEIAEMAIVPSPGASTAAGLVAVVLESRSDAWATGDVRARFTQREDGSYIATLFMDDRSPRFVEARSFKNGLILRLAPWAWGRRYPIAAHQDGLLDDSDPRAPTLSVREDDSAVVLSIPSHDPRFRERLQTLVAASAAALARADALVIDLRGNEGGSSGTTNVLEPYYWSPSPAAATDVATEDTPVVLASQDTLRAFQSWTEWFDETPEWLTDLLHRLDQNMGELVPMATDDGDGGHDVERATILGPRRVGILTDAGTVSAAEAFVLKAQRHERVVIFGQNTGGSIDYQNVQIVRLACRDRGFGLGFPLIASSTRLPEGGYNRGGIPPDVRIDVGVADPISVILESGR